jgi:hypothetical protein
LYVGAPTKQEQYGTEPKIQANDAFIDASEIIQWVNQEKDKLPENEREQLTIAMKVDVDVKRGILADVETELRKGNARKVLYTTREKDETR